MIIVDPAILFVDELLKSNHDPNASKEMRNENNQSQKTEEINKLLLFVSS